MRTMKHSAPKRSAGFSMIEVLITIIILAFGLLGLAGMQVHIQTAEMESYQRAQALILASEMTERLAANRSIASQYVTSTAIGTNDGYTDCSGETVGSANRDKCEWSLALKGSSELAADGTSVGAMIGARGCVTQTQARDATSGVCTPDMFRVDVVWQGLAPTVAPAVTCGAGSFGTDTYRRAVSRVVTIGIPDCS